MIGKGYKRNFDTLLKAVQEGSVCLLDCRHRETGEQAVMLCAVAFDGAEYHMTPFAVMCSGSPYEDYIPPMEEGMKWA